MNTIITITKEQSTTLKTIQNRGNLYPSDMGMILCDCSAVNKEDYLEVLDEKKFYSFLKENYRDSYRNDRMDEHNDLVNIRTQLFKKFTISNTYTKKSRNYGDIEFNVHYNPLKDYGSFEYYNNDGDVYAEGGLWFRDGALYDYDGVYSLPKSIRKQLDEWKLDTSYLD